MNLRSKLNWGLTIALIILIELFLVFLLYEWHTDPVWTKTYHKEKAKTLIQVVPTEESVEDGLTKTCTGLDSDAVHSAGMPDGTKGFYNAENNLVWYLLPAPDEPTAESYMETIKKGWGNVQTETDTRHETVCTIQTDTIAGISARSHTLVLVGISRDGKHMDSLRQVMTDLGLIRQKGD